MRRFSIWAIIAVFALTIIWSVLWHYARGFAEDQVDQVLAVGSDGDPTIFCKDRHIGGYPFRLILACSTAGIDLRSADLSADLGGLNVTALAYKPQHVVAEFSAPLNIVTGFSGTQFKADWSSGRSSVRISGRSFSRFSAAFQNLAVAGSNIALAAADAQLHARPAEAGDGTDLAFSADDAAFGMDGQTSAPFSLSARVQLDAAPEAILAGVYDGAGPNLKNIDILVASGESRLAAAGELSFTAAGTASGKIVITAKNLKDLAAFLQTLPDRVSTGVQRTVGSMIALGKPGKDGNGDPVSELTLRILDNQIFVGDLLIADLGPGS